MIIESAHHPAKLTSIIKAHSSSTKNTTDDRTSDFILDKIRNYPPKMLPPPSTQQNVHGKVTSTTQPQRSGPDRNEAQPWLARHYENPTSKPIPSDTVPTQTEEQHQPWIARHYDNHTSKPTPSNTVPRPSETVLKGSDTVPTGNQGKIQPWKTHFDYNKDAEKFPSQPIAKWTEDVRLQAEVDDMGTS